MTKVNYERYNTESQNGYWEIASKEFNTLKDAYIFVNRIVPNIIVRRIWIQHKRL